MNVKAMDEKRYSSASVAASLLVMIGATIATLPVEAGPKIVVLGDSLSAGYQLPPGKGFPDRLQAALDAKNIDVEIIGAGVSGDTTSGGLARLDWSVPDDIDAVIVELGANDAMRGIPAEKADTNLNAILEKLSNRKIKVLITGMLAPPNMGADYGKKFNGIYPALAQKYDALLYPFFLDGVAAQADLNLSDGIHPNEKGIDIIVERIMPMVEKLIGQLPQD